MNMLKTVFLASAMSCAIGLAGASCASALSLGGTGADIVKQNADSGLIEQVQRRRGGGFRGGRRGVRGPVVRGGRGGVRRGWRGGRRGIGPGGAAAIGLGIGLLGAAAAASAAGAPPPPAYAECWWERRPVYNRWGDYVGTRRTRICQ